VALAPHRWPDWLRSFGSLFCCNNNKAQLVGRLTALPLGAVAGRTMSSAACPMGVRTIGQALRLPRAGFARRFGPAHLREPGPIDGPQVRTSGIISNRESASARPRAHY